MGVVNTAAINGYVSPYPVDPMPDWVAALRDSAEPLWLFAYGSLMWNPEMPFAERRPALLRGYHRSFCLYSRDYRGTPERPGLVLGLDRGGACRGIAYRLPQDGLGPAIDRVWAREMAGEVYRMRPITVATPQGRPPVARRGGADHRRRHRRPRHGARLSRQYGAPPRGARHRRRPAAPARKQGGHAAGSELRLPLGRTIMGEEPG
jgi:hypothetical protein